MNKERYLKYKNKYLELKYKNHNGGLKLKPIEGFGNLNNSYAPF